MSRARQTRGNRGGSLQSGYEAPTLGEPLLAERHKEVVGKIWEIANRLRGPYRPPQYRLVMLPIVVLRRLDCVLEPTKDAVLAEYVRLVAAGQLRTPFPGC